MRGTENRGANARVLIEKPDACQYVERQWAKDVVIRSPWAIYHEAQYQKRCGCRDGDGEAAPQGTAPRYLTRLTERAGRSRRGADHDDPGEYPAGPRADPGDHDSNRAHPAHGPACLRVDHGRRIDDP